MAVNVTGGGLEFDVTLNSSRFQRQLDEIQRDLNRLTMTAEERGADLENVFKKASLAAASFFSIQQAQNFVSQLVAVRGEFEQLEIAYSTILKSKVKGDALFQETIKLASTTPFNLTEVAQSTKQLLAYGVEANKVTDTLKMLGDVASGVSAPIGDIAYLYGTLKTQGRAYLMDIRQFTGRGIPIIQELAKQFHVTEDEVNKLVEAGKVGFPEVEKAFKSLTGAGGIFFNLMEAQSQTLTGRLSNLQDSFDQMLNNLGKANSGILNSGISALANLVDNYKAVLDIIELLIVAYGVYKAVTIVTTAVQALQAAGAAALTAQELLHYGALVLVERAQQALNNTAVVGAAATAAYTAVITAIIAIVYAYANATDRASESQKNLNDIAAEAQKNTIKQRDLVESLNKTATDLNKTEELRLAAVNKLREIMPDRLKNYTDEQIEAGKARKAIDDYTDALVNNARIAAAQGRITELQGQLIDLDTKGFAAIPTADRLSGSLTKFGSSLLGAAVGKGFGSFLTNDAELLAEQKQKIKGEIDDISKIYGDGIAKLNAQTEGNNPPPGKGKTAAYFQKIIDENTQSLKDLDKSSAEFKIKAPIYKKNIQDAQKELEAFDPKAEKRNNDAYQKEIERRGGLLREIYELNQRYNAKSAEDDQAKLLAISADFDKLKAKIEAFNANSRNSAKIGSNVIANINNAEFNAQRNQADLNENETIKKDLEIKKQLYSDYESYREKLGKDAADKQYGELLKSGDTFLEYLRNLSKANEENLNGVTAGALAERKEITTKYKQDELTAQNNVNVELLSTTLTYEQQRNLIIEKYLKQAADLRAQGNQEQALQAIQNGKDELTALDEANIQKMNAYKELFDGITVLSNQRAQQDIKYLRKVIDSALKAGSITKEAYDKINKQLNDAEVNVKRSLPDGLRAIASGFGEVANSVSKLDENLGRALGTLGNMLNSVANIKDNFNNISKPGTDIFGKVSSGLNIVGSAVGIVSGIGELLSNNKEEEAKRQYQQQLQIKAIEAVNKALERQLQLTKETYGPERLAAYNRDLKSIDQTYKDQQAKLKGLITLSDDPKLNETITKINAGGDFRKNLISSEKADYEKYINQLKATGQLIDLSKSSLDDLINLSESGKLDEKTAAIVKSLIDLDSQGKETFKSLQEEVTGISFDSLNNDIKSVFENGESSVEKFADAIEKNIRSAFANSFQRNEIDKAMQPFYDQLYTAGKDGIFTDDEIKSLREQRDAISKTLADKAAAYEKIIGENDPAADDKTLTGQIKSAITEETATIIAGTLQGTQLNTYNTHMAVIRYAAEFKAFHDEVMESNVRKLNLLESIDKNTKGTKDNTDGIKDVLDKIARNTSDTSSAILRNKGY